MRQLRGPARGTNWIRVLRHRSTIQNTGPPTEHLRRARVKYVSRAEPQYRRRRICSSATFLSLVTLMKETERRFFWYPRPSVVLHGTTEGFVYCGCACTLEESRDARGLYGGWQAGGRSRDDRRTWMTERVRVSITKTNKRETKDNAADNTGGCRIGERALHSPCSERAHVERLRRSVCCKRTVKDLRQ